MNTSTDRFLFGEYRKAAEYKGFPTVLLAEGQLKGTVPEHASEYFKLNRYAEKAWTVWGRAESNMASYVDGNSEISFNRMYKKWDFDERDTRTDPAKYDFVQGSTYPFAETIYSSLRQGFEDAIPDGMKKTIGLFTVELSTDWDDDTLMQGSSTFIPTVSAMDLNCGGDLAIRGDCAFTQNSTDFPFTNPGSRSSADVVYAVDPTHPRYNETISGRHVELPCEDESTCLYSNVVSGLRVDLWRMLCELANLNYNENTKMYANEKLAGYFVPGTSCMDQRRIPILIRAFGLARSQGFAYSRYMYNSDATELDEDVSFDVPAGWHKVSQHDMGSPISQGFIFEVEVRVNRSNGNWMKTELLLSKGKNGADQLQMKEIEIPMDGEFHRIRWNLPMSYGATENYRWFTVVLNSEGSNVTVRQPHVLTNNVRENVPKESVASQIYPGDLYSIYPWTEEQSVSAYSDALGSGMELKYERIGGGIVDFGQLMSLEAYSNLKLTFWPGTCSGTGVYFDSYKKGLVKMGSGNMEGNFAVTEIPLDEIINTLYTPEYSKAASRLVFENTSVSERCLIRSIQLK